ncbi:MAG: TrpB-like pyridoxal phosphate-dependent enzyme [Actinomycetota bacterium]|nr:TrpB-like pyridoxal phosphate-dependent enzyme [Actinomycetota bacterium]
MEETKIILSEREMPTAWYNILPDLPKPLEPYLNPQTKEPSGLALPPPLFAAELSKQESSTERWIDIPGKVIDIYRLYRPTPLFRAKRLEAALDTPAKIYYKYEGWSPPGSHKPNTAIAQAYYAKEQGVKRLTTETGAGQWGSALTMACRLMDLDCTVYMVKVSYHQKPYRRVLMETWGAQVIPSPSEKTQCGQEILAKDPECPGSLGIAISEAVEDAGTHDDALYSLGSVLNHVLLHQTIIGLECKKQFEKIDEYPDVIFGCIGGGSSLGGICLPFVKDKLEGKKVRVVAVEPTACPTLTKGIYAYDYGDTAHLAPIAKMYTLGHTFVPPPIHAGGLRYHGDSPLMCALYDQGIIEAQAHHQNPVFEAAVTFAQAEGIVPAPETAHAVKAAIDEAIKCKKSGESENILINFTGHGYFDLAAYDDYLAGKLADYEYPREKIEEALAHLPKI